MCILLMAGCKGKDERDGGHGPAAQSNPEAEKAAVECTEQWLAVLDQGDYQQAWEQTAEIFKEIVPIDQWRTDDVLVQRHVLAVPGTAEAAEVGVLVGGAYWLDDLSRLETGDGAGEFIVSNVRIVP